MAISQNCEWSVSPMGRLFFALVALSCAMGSVGCRQSVAPAARKTSHSTDVAMPILRAIDWNTGKNLSVDPLDVALDWLNKQETVPESPSSGCRCRKHSLLSAWPRGTNLGRVVILNSSESSAGIRPLFTGKQITVDDVLQRLDELSARFSTVVLYESATATEKGSVHRLSEWCRRSGKTCLVAFEAGLNSSAPDFRIVVDHRRAPQF